VIEMTDEELLRGFCLNNREAAFTELVERYLGMVRGVGRRRTGNPELADEIAQNVFTALARKAADLPPKVNLAGWLHRAAVLESTYALRSEYTRHEKIKQLAQMTNDTDATNWNEIRPELDEAINQLAERDRVVVVMRFVQERTLAQIGEQIGKSESATQRHLQRTLEKLSAILKKRGITATTAGLAFVLGTKIDRVTSTGLLVSKITESALYAKAGGSTAAIAATTITTITMTKTNTLIATGLLLVGALTTGSIILGKHRASSEKANATLDSPAPIQSSSAQESESAKTNDNLREARPPLHELMEKLRMLALSTDPKRNEKIEQILAQVGADQMPEALDFLQNLSDPKVYGTLAFHLFQRWGQIDGVTASMTDPGGDRTIRDRAARGLAKGWSSHDPEAAWKWYRSLEDSEFELTTRVNVLQEIFATWLEAEPAIAARRFETLSFDEQKSAIQYFGALGKRPDKAAEVAEAIALLTDETMQLEIIADFGENWAGHDAPAAMAWFDTLEFENEERAFRGATEIIDPLMDSDPATALDWLWPKAPEFAKEHGLRFVREQWARKNRTAAEKWLRENGYEPNEVLDK